MLTCKETTAILNKLINHLKFLNIIKIDITEKSKALWGPLTLKKVKES